MELLILLSGILMLISWVSDRKRKYNPLVIFNGLWLFIYVLYEIDLFDFIITLDTSTYIILAVMQVGFTLGGILGTKLKLRIGSRNGILPIRPGTQWALREKIFIVLSGIAIAILFTEEMQIIIKLINGMSFHTLMAEAEGKGTVSYTGALSVSLHLFFVHPMSYAISPICAVEVLYRRNKPLLYFLINAAMVALSVAHHGGRNALFQMLICYVAVFLISERDVGLRRSTKVLLVAGILLIFTLINSISESRGISNIGESFYGYFICSIPLSNEYLHTKVATDHYMMGLLSFKGFVGPVFTVLNYFGIPSPGTYAYVRDFCVIFEDMYMNIGKYEPHRFNHFMPAGVYPYVDGGYFFEFIIMTIYGWVTGSLFRRVKELATRNTLNMCLFAIFFVGVSLSFIRFWFTTYHYAFAVLYILALYKPQKEDYV